MQKRQFEKNVNFLFWILFSSFFIFTNINCGRIWGGIAYLGHGSNQTHVSQTFMYTCGQNGNYLQGFYINYGKGTFPTVSVPSPSGATCQQIQLIKISPTLQLLAEYSAGNGLEVFQINPATGALTSVSGSPAVPASDYFVVDPTNQYIYAINNVTTSVNVFSINQSTGGLTYVTNSAFLAGTHWWSIPTITQNGSFIYHLNPQDNLFEVMQVAGNKTTLTPAALALPAFCNGQPAWDLSQLTLNSQFYFLSCSNGASSDLWSYTINGGTGALTNVTSLAGLFQNAGFSFDLTNTYLYYQNGFNTGVNSYTLNSGTGALTVNNGGVAYGPGITGLNPIIDLTNTFLMANNGIYSLSGGGVLIPSASSPFSPPSINSIFFAFDPTGTLLFFDDATTTSIYVDQLNRISGSVSAINGGSPISTSGSSNDGVVIGSANSSWGVVFATF